MIRLTDQIGKQIQKECSKIFPLENVLIRKVKVLKKPKFDLTKLMELYTAKADAPAATTTVSGDAQNLLSKQ
jgi:small subunit ribosomal protein S3Ae